MNLFSQLVHEIGNRLPKYNYDLLVTYREKEINKAKEFIELVLKEALKLLGGQVQYKGYRICDPIERAQYELNTKNSSTSGKNNIRITHGQLVEFICVFDGEEFSFKEYILYSYNGKIVINDTKYAVLLSVSEKVFTIMRNGIGSRVIRQPIRTYRTMHRIRSLNSGVTYFDNIILTNIYNKKPTKIKVQPTIIHYLLCRYGFIKTLGIFGINERDVVVQKRIDISDETYEYFSCRKMVKKNNLGPLYMKVNKKILTNDNVIARRVVINIIYLLEYFDIHDVDDIYNEKNHIFKIMLGKLTHGVNTTPAHALEYMNNHINSIATYLDPLTKERLASMDIHINDVYDLLIYIFKNISQFLMTNKKNDLFNKRIDVTDNMWLSAIVAPINKKFYPHENKELNDKAVRGMLRLNPWMTTRLNEEPNILMSPSCYNSNEFLTWMNKKVRSSSGNKNTGGTSVLSDPELRLHPSTFYVESGLAFSSSNPGSSGHINPFLLVDLTDGSVMKDDWVEELEKIRKYLPYV